MLFPSRSKSFTLLELLIVIGILAVLSTALIMVIRPAEQFRKGRDSSRVSQLDSLRTALNMALMENIDLGEDHTVYLSLPSNDPSCSDLSLPPLPNSWTYHCSNSQNFRKIDGTGWLPIDFTQDDTINLPALPIDPVNTVQGGYYYTYAVGGSWELTAQLESQRHTINQATDGGLNPARYELGTDTKLTPFVNGLVGSWSFNETSGTIAYDSSGFGNHGTMYSSTTPTYLISNNTLNLDGVDDYVTADNISVATSIGTKNTVTFWMYKKGGSMPFAFDRAVTRYDLYFDCGGFGFNTGDGNVEGISNSSFLSSSWHHIVAIFPNGIPNNSNAELWIDGSKQTINHLCSSGPSSRVASQRIYISGWDPISEKFKGFIDDVRIYNRALSANEIQAIYEASKLNY
jgi:type II secretory pathway pseudopilin PulG